MPNIIKSLQDGSVPAVNENFRKLYEKKVEAGRFFDGSSSQTVFKIFPELEVGRLSFSATGSPVVSKVIQFDQPRDTILWVQAHAVSNNITAHISNVTNSQITVSARSISGTADFSDVTTDTVSVFFAVLSSNP